MKRKIKSYNLTFLILHIWVRLLRRPGVKRGLLAMTDGGNDGVENREKKRVKKGKIRGEKGCYSFQMRVS